ncbi:hypothetical protein PTKIN_Ptkin14bG0148700 [Pterospermum kingtungense]
MICSAGGFLKLDSLSLESLSNLEELQVDDGAMPVLRRLEIVNCRKMKMVPDGLIFITTLQELEIKRMPKAFKDKLVEGGEDAAGMLLPALHEGIQMVHPILWNCLT